MFSGRGCSWAVLGGLLYSWPRPSKRRAAVCSHRFRLTTSTFISLSISTRPSRTQVPVLARRSFQCWAGSSCWCSRGSLNALQSRQSERSSHLWRQATSYSPHPVRLTVTPKHHLWPCPDSFRQDDLILRSNQRETSFWFKVAPLVLRAFSQHFHRE